MSAVADFPVKPEVRPYLDRLVQIVEHERPQAVRHVLLRNLARFAELGFPNRKSEGWRYIDLEPLRQGPLLPRVGRHDSDIEAAQAQLGQLNLPDADVRIVLVDGVFAWDLSKPDMNGEAGLWCGSVGMAYAESNGAEFERMLFSNVIEDISKPAADSLAALNAVSFIDGYMLDVAAKTKIDKPIQIVHLVTQGTPASYHTRNLISLGEGSSAKIMEVFAGESRYWRNDVTAAWLSNEAELHRVVLVEETSQAIHVGRLDATLGPKAALSSFALLLAGSRARQEWKVQLAGQGASCRLDGAYVVSGNDEANIVTTVDHAAPGGQTRELIKGVAAGRGHGAFQGRIVVQEGAQQTDAHQLSRNLLIGERAVIDTKPELEIYADDVKCSHGASVGDLDEAALFYLRARGIPDAEARHMLIDGFLREAVESIDDFAIRTHLLRRLAARLATLEGSA